MLLHGTTNLNPIVAGAGLEIVYPWAATKVFRQTGWTMFLFLVNANPGVFFFTCMCPTGCFIGSQARTRVECSLAILLGHRTCRMYVSSTFFRLMPPPFTAHHCNTGYKQNGTQNRWSNCAIQAHVLPRATRPIHRTSKIHLFLCPTFKVKHFIAWVYSHSTPPTNVMIVITLRGATRISTTITIFLAQLFQDFSVRLSEVYCYNFIFACGWHHA